MLVNYDVPVKLLSESTHRKHSVVNWTLANHTVIRGNQNWMYREENKAKVHSYSNEDVEQKILNTEKFHSDICTQCNIPKTWHMNTIEKINTGLRKIRIARLFSYILFFGFVPVSMLFISLDFPVPFSLIPYGILFLLVSSYAALQKCPRCGEFFFWNMDKSVLGYRNPFTNKCLNCKVSIKNNQNST